MGSKFFDPIGYAVQKFAPNSGLSHAISNDPIANATGFQNGKSQHGAPVTGQGAYAGQAPTLAASRNFYGAQPTTYAGGWQG